MDVFSQMLKRKKERKKEEEEDLEFALIDRRHAAARGAGKNSSKIFFPFKSAAATAYGYDLTNTNAGETAEENLLKVQIYFTTLNIQRITEEQVYSVRKHFRFLRM